MRWCIGWIMILQTWNMQHTIWHTNDDRYVFPKNVLINSIVMIRFATRKLESSNMNAYQPPKKIYFFSTQITQTHTNTLTSNLVYTNDLFVHGAIDLCEATMIIWHRKLASLIHANDIWEIHYILDASVFQIWVGMEQDERWKKVAAAPQFASCNRTISISWRKIHSVFLFGASHPQTRVHFKQQYDTRSIFPMCWWIWQLND